MRHITRATIKCNISHPSLSGPHLFSKTLSIAKWDDRASSVQAVSPKINVGGTRKLVSKDFGTISGVWANSGSFSKNFRSLAPDRKIFSMGQQSECVGVTDRCVATPPHSSK